MESVTDILFWFFIACCAVLLVIIIALIIAVHFFKKTLERSILGDVSVVEKKYFEYSRKYPNKSQAELINKVINSESLSAGILGFFVGLGGLITLPVAIPIDIFATLRIQSRLIEFIAKQAGGKDIASDEFKIKTYALLVGTHQLHKLGIKFVVRIISKFIPKYLLNSIPIVGGITGFLFNWISTKGIGKGLAMKYTNGKVTAQKQGDKGTET